MVHRPVTPLLFFLACLWLVGCVSVPPKVRVPGEAAQWLGGQPRVVVRLDAGQVKAWSEVTRANDSLKAVGERTRAVWMGFELNNLDDLAHAADTVRIVLEGDFPKGGAAFLLDWNSAWKKEPLAGVWTNPAMGLSVTLPDDGLVTVRRGDASLPQASLGILRNLDPAAVERAAAWISIWNPGEALFGSLGNRVLPVERLDVVFDARGDTLEGPVILYFGDDRGPRVAAVLLKLAGGAIRARLGQDLEWTADGNRLVGQTLRVNQNDLKALAEKLVADPPEVK